IDRRFAVIAAGAAHLESADSYGSALHSGERPDGESRMMIASYVDTAEQVERKPLGDVFGRYAETASTLRHVGLPEEEAAKQIFELYQRHAQQVLGVVEDGVAQSGKAIRLRSHPESCIVRLVHDPRPSSGVASMQATMPRSRPRYQLTRIG